MKIFISNKANIVTLVVITFVAVSTLSVLFFSNIFSSSQIDANSFLDRVSIDIPEEPAENQIIVRFTEVATEEERLSYIESLGGTVNEEIKGLNTIVANVPEGINEDNLPESEIVAKSEPNYYVGAMKEESQPVEGTANPENGQEYPAPNDPYYEQQWALEVMNVQQAWNEVPENAERVTVAVIDSGVCLDHPDLEGRILPGYDFVEDDNVPQDEFDHGCGVAGVIAANTNNGIGIAGIAPNAMILPVRVLDENGLGTYSDLAAGIVWAVDNGAEIISLGLGGYNQSEVLKNAVEYAIQAGALIIAAGGNDGVDKVTYPAVYDSVLGIGSLEGPLKRSEYSNYGYDITLWGPGSNIITLSKDGGYKSMNGTSLASAHVPGIALLEMARGKDLVLDNSYLSLGGIIPEGFSKLEMSNQPAVNSNQTNRLEDNEAISRSTTRDVKVGAPCILHNNVNYVNDNRYHWDGSTYPIDMPIGTSALACSEGNLRASISGDVDTYTVTGWCSYWGENRTNTHLDIYNSTSGIKTMHLHHETDYTSTVDDGYVEAGEVLATIGNEGCSDGRHIHFQVYHNNALQYYNQWEFCEPPDTSVDWTINKHCTINSPITAPRNVYVQGGVTVTVGHTGSLNVDFVNYKLQVSPDSKVEVMTGGKIY